MSSDKFLVELSETQLIHILNCLVLTKNNMWNREFIKGFYDKEYYNNDYNDILDLYKLLSIKGNSYFYNRENSDMFVGQYKFWNMKEKDMYKFMKQHKKKNINIKNNKFIYNIIIDSRDYFKKYFTKNEINC